MSGFTSSQRQWMSKRVRALAASVLALAMLIPLFSIASAQPTQPVPYPAQNVLCITGTIINFDETPLDGGWVVTATAIDPPGPAMVTQTNDKGYFEFLNLSPGRWTVMLSRKANWEPVAPYTDSFDVTLSYGSDECAEVRFKVKRPIDVWVYKIDDDHEPLEGWIIRATPGKGNWFASTVEVATDEDGLAAFRLTEGKWVFSEKGPKHQKYMPIIPDDGKQEVDVHWDDDWGSTPQKFTLRFKNRLYYKGCIVVTKTDVPPEDDMIGAFGLPGWEIIVKRPDGSIAASGETDAMGEIQFDHLPFGPYIVTEESRLGWDAVGPSSYQVYVSQPDIGDDPVCEEVTFFNKQNPPGFCIEGYKIDANDEIGLPGWKITATPVYKGGYPNKDVDGTDKLEAVTDGTGKYRFDFPNNDYRMSGAAYKVCEEQRDGWLPHTATCQTVYMPYKPAACVKAWDFVNQQVGHSEAVLYGQRDDKYGKHGKHGHHYSSEECDVVHEVVAGESLYGIGNAYGVPASEMLDANEWVYDRPNYYLYTGDEVCIP